MRVQDLQQFLSSFTAANKDGSRQGNAISNAVIMVQINGHLEKVVRMEVQENSTPIIGHKQRPLVLCPLKLLQYPCTMVLG
jgi:hypothetical protein